MINNNKNTSLSIVVTRRMVQRFLVEKQMTIEQLAKTLNIEAEILENFFSPHVPKQLVSEINLPLIELYCSTKWD